MHVQDWILGGDSYNGKQIVIDSNFTSCGFIDNHIHCTRHLYWTLWLRGAGRGADPVGTYTYSGKW